MSVPNYKNIEYINILKGFDPIEFLKLKPVGIADLAASPRKMRGIFERRQIPYRIVHYSEIASSLYLRQPRQSLNLG